jgi:hypothetical protein
MAFGRYPNRFSLLPVALTGANETAHVRKIQDD